MLISFNTNEHESEPTAKRKPITLIPFADMHTGGTTAFHPIRLGEQLEKIIV